MSRPRQSTARRALSLVEMVVLAGVVSLIVIFTVGMIPSFKLSNRRANMELQAGALAQTRLEELRVAPFESLSSVASEDRVVDEISYHIEVSSSVELSAGSPPEPISKRVRVEVSWTWKDRPYQIFRETILCRLLRS
jgi:hypothetical protein